MDDEDSFPQHKYGFTNIRSYIALTIFILTWISTRRRHFAQPRSIITLLSCSLMVVLTVITPEEAFNGLYSETLLTISGFMIISLLLEEKGWIEIIKSGLLCGKDVTPLKFLVRVSISSAVLSALFMSDIMVVLSPIVFAICEENGLTFEPYLIALTTSANIGSAATVIGNAKNLIINDLAEPEFSFSKFSQYLGPPSIVGTILNTLFIYLSYRDKLDSIPLKQYIPKRTNRLPESALNDSPYAGTSTITENARRHTFSELDSDEENVMFMIENNDASGDDDRDSMEDLSDNEGETEYLFSKSKDPRLQPLYTDTFTSSPETLPPPMNYSHEIPVPMYDEQRDGPYAIRRETKPNQASLTRFIWTAPPLSRENRVFPQLHIASIFKGTNIHKRIDFTRKMFADEEVVKKTLFLIIILGMYIGYFVGESVGFTTITGAIILLMIDGRDARGVFEKLNWNLLIYLVGMFGIIQGLMTTPFPDLFWKHYGANIIKPEEDPKFLLSIITFSVLITVLCYVFGSVPTVLLVAPYIPSSVPSWLRNDAWLLFVWGIAIYGNFTATSSSAGMIVTAAAKTHLVSTPNVRPYEFRVWGKYSSWSTIIIFVVGMLIIILRL
ncbi:3524_t:CDS:2 [Paraglomus occultum]|uniref:3524_t:CDS:1 n=1 Tax=Paraglomus occultum TaxID=144539 RepID=A0A9N9FHT4_9GLOM|nr:3524_t:CDS:2 [Paraglomus occultum]